MSERLERLKLTRCGQRGTVTKNCQEVNLLLEADTLEPASIYHLITILGVLEDKLIILKTLDDEFSDMCPLEEVEQETVESKEVSGLIIECVSHRLRA